MPESPTALPRSLRQGISVQKIGSETLVYDQRRHQAFCLNESASMVWELANGERTLADLATQAATALDTPVNQDLVLLALQQLRDEELLEPEPDRQPEMSVSRRDLLLKLGVGCTALLPAIASIVAPTAAQAYSGCVDCSVAPGRAPQRIRRAPITPINPTQ